MTSKYGAQPEFLTREQGEADEEDFLRIATGGLLAIDAGVSYPLHGRHLVRSATSPSGLPAASL